MPFSKADTPPRGDLSAGGGGVALIAAWFWRRSSGPNARYYSGLDVKEAGNMMAKRRKEGWSRKRKMRNSTDNNGVSKRGQTADEEKNKKYYFVAASGVVSHPLFRQNPTVCLQIDARCGLLDCEAYTASISYVKFMFAALPWIRHPLLLNSHYFK